MTHSSKSFTIALVVLGLIVFAGAFYMTYREDREHREVPSSTVSTTGGQQTGSLRKYESRPECDGIIYYDIQKALQTADTVCALVLRDVRSLYAETTRLRNLSELVIRSDEITVLPEFVGDLSLLEVLDVAGSAQLRAFLPDLFGMNNLRLLNIAGTSITIMPNGIDNLKNLERFFVHQGQFSATELTDLRSKLPNTQIIELDPKLVSQ